MKATLVNDDGLRTFVAVLDKGDEAVDEQVEVLSLVGDIAVADTEPKLHVHVVLGRRDGTTCGGHLLEGIVWPTLEIVLTEAPAHLQRRTDAETGLALIDIDRSG